MEVEKMKTSFKNHTTWSHISLYLKKNYREFFNKLSNVTYIDLPSWILSDYDEEIDVDSETDEGQDSSDEETDENDFHDESDDGTERSRGRFQRVQRKQLTNFEKWLRGKDIKRIEEMNLIYKDIDLDDDEYIDEYDKILYVRNYEIPETNRSLDVLLKNNSIWQMSNEERQKLKNFWRAKFDEETLLNLQEMHEECRQDLNDIYDDARRQRLLISDVIGMTTSGAAKFQNLIKYIDPKIIICEEAGEVLEAHILSALAPSTQHLILIGDHNQLRPRIANYSLSLESYMGENYQLDKSLFERFVDGSNPIRIEKTRLLTQRRMRKEISDLIRYTIYEDLEDGENTTTYPNIRGVQHNVYFIDHNNPEDRGNGDSAMQSHSNIYEVKMVVEMVKYFIKYGYTKPEDIAVLTPYSGQLIKIKDALSKLFVVDIDERDAENIADAEEEENDTSKSLDRRITIRTVDNFQGEEAKIVIISLVRNYSGNKYSSIGFLKTVNRSNVLLSRAREGMYLIGNSKLMESKSKDMWAPVVNILRERDQVGPGLPIVCKHHPDCKNVITEPEQFEEVCSPNGGCRSICNMPLSCGHTCVDECHFNNLEHAGVKCREPCKKLYSECGHQCPKLCYKDCDICSVPVGNIILPCGHILKNAECWQNQIKEKIKCETVIDIVLPDCEHPLQNIECWRVQNEKFICQFLIDITLPDCGHPLNVECWKVKNNNKFTCHTLIDIPLPCGHILENTECWENKNKEKILCKTSIEYVLPDCGHKNNVDCWRIQNKEKFTCQFPMNITLPCGHEKNVECWRVQNEEKFACTFLMDITLPCGHEKNVECWRVQNEEKFACTFPMDITLPCGHEKNVECWRVQNKEKFTCQFPMDITLPCGHPYRNVECCRVQSKEKFTCRHKIDIILPCEHVLENAECWQNETKETIKCEIIIDTVVLPDCGHLLQNIKCWRVQNNEEFTCNTLVDIKLPCGHSSTFKIECCKKDQIKNIPKCNVLVDIELPCGHISKYVECWKNQNNETILCNTSIDFELPCGHILKDIKCWVRQSENIPKCSNVLDEIMFPCGHTLSNVECWKKKSIKCEELVKKRMPNCEHTNVIQVYLFA
jgi:hypothetical protein